MGTSAASIIRHARLRARMTQTELAAGAGIAQTVVSAYESAKREPSYEMLRKLVSATGFDLDMVLVPAEARSTHRRSIDNNRARLKRALRQLGVRDVKLFGSVARGEDEAHSDIDLLVEVGPSVGLFALGQMRSRAEQILGATVDIVPANSLKPDVAGRILAEAIPL